MMYALVIAAFLVLHAHEYFGTVLPPHTLSPTATLAATWIPIFALWLAGHAVISACGRELNRTGRLTSVRTAERFLVATRIAGLGLLAIDVFFVGWFDLVREAMGPWAIFEDVVLLAPFLALLIGGWWSIEPVERRLHEAVLLRDLESGIPVHAPYTRGEFVINAVRHRLLLVLCPLLLISFWGNAVSRMQSSLGWHGDEPGANAHAIWVNIVHFAGIAGIVAIFPVLLASMWNTVRLGDGPLRTALLAVCSRTGVRVRELLVWRTRGTIFNAAVIGVVAPLRYIVVTDALLERLPERQLEAVTAHEAGHIKHKHLIWLALSTLATTGLMATGLWWAFQRLGLIPANADDESFVNGLGELGASAAAFIVGIIVFGMVSRRFEWQADAFAAADLSRHAPGDVRSRSITDEAVSAMVGALAGVAVHNGIDPWRFTFRHGSIVERQSRLRHIAGLPITALPIDRACRIIKVSSLIGVAGLIALIALGGVR